MKKYWKLFWHFRKIDLMRMMEYRTDFVFWLVVSLMWTGFNYFFISLIFGKSTNVYGWSYDELLIVLSLFTMIDALTWSVFYNNMIEYTNAVFNGELSKHLLRPVNTIFVLTTQKISYNNVPRFIIGLIVLVSTAIKLDVSVSLFDLLLVTLLFICGMVFIYSGWFILATLSLWVEKLQNINDIMPGFRQVYQVPRQVYTGITAFTFTFIFPIALITSLPGEVITGKNPPLSLILYFIGATTGMALLAKAFFAYSIRKYSSVGG
ncbi:MAG: ABC-2 family transporter protein [Pseudomonadales bacterium]|nr:ABC-2 family transporter protein [Pseudomonadales bacterium]